MNEENKAQYFWDSGSYYQIVQTETAYKGHVLTSNGTLREVNAMDVMMSGDPVSEEDFMEQVKARSANQNTPKTGPHLNP